MEKVTEATLHLEKVTEAMAKCNLSLEYLKVTEAMHMSCRRKKKVLGTFSKMSVGQKQIMKLVC